MKSLLKKFSSIPFFEKLLLSLVVFFFFVCQVFEAYLGLNITTAILTSFSASLFILLIVRNKRLVFPKIITILYGIFVLWHFIIFPFTKDVGLSIFEVVRITSYFMLFIAVYNIAHKSKEITQLLLTSLTFIGVAILARDFYDLVSNNELINGPYLSGSFYWHNQIAGYMLFIIPILLQFLIEAKRVRNKILLSIPFIFVLYLFVIAYSRGAWLSLIVSLLFFFFFKRSSLKSFLPIAVIIAIISFGFLFFTGKINTATKVANSIQSETMADTRTVSGELRTTVWKNTIRMALVYPVTGVGPNVFGNAYYEFQTDPFLYSKFTHNHFLQLAADLGIPGISIFLSIFAYFFYIIITKQNAFYNEKKYPLLLSIATGIIATSLHALVDFDWSVITLYGLFWTFLALYFSYVSDRKFIIKMKGASLFIYLIPLFILIVGFVLQTGEKNFNTASMYIEKEELKTANYYYQQAIQYNPFESRYRTSYALLLLNQRNVKEAKEQLEAALRYSYFNSEPYFLLGSVYFINKDIPTANKLFQRSVQANHLSFPKYFIALSDTDLLLGKRNEAKKVLHDAVYHYFPFNRAYKDFAYIYNKTDFPKELKFLYIKLIKLEQEDGNTSEVEKLTAAFKKEYGSAPSIKK